VPVTTPIACSLDQAELPDRAAEMARLGAQLVAVHAEGRRAELKFAADRGPIDQFVRDESRCCPFFEFEVSSNDLETTLAVSAPADGEWAVRGLVAGFVSSWGGLV
jgi:hypothetical protein